MNYLQVRKKETRRSRSKERGGGRLEDSVVKAKKRGDRASVSSSRSFTEAMEDVDEKLYGSKVRV